METLRKLSYSKGDADFVFQVGSYMNERKVIVKRIEKLTPNDFIVYVSLPNNVEITKWKQIHVPNSSFIQEEFDYEVSISR